MPEDTPFALPPPEVPSPKAAILRCLRASSLVEDTTECTCDELGSIFSLRGPSCRVCSNKPTGTATGKYIRVRLGESHVYGLLDSGSTVTVIHPRALRRLLKQDTFRADDEDPLVEGPFEDHLVGRAVNGTEFSLNKWYRVRITIGTVSVMYPVRVCALIDGDLILGEDFRDYAQMSWLFSGPSPLPTFHCAVEVIASVQPPSMGIRSLKAKADTIIPP